jgi:hypothetical protein
MEALMTETAGPAKQARPGWRSKPPPPRRAIPRTVSRPPTSSRARRPALALRSSPAQPGPRKVTGRAIPAIGGDEFPGLIPAPANCPHRHARAGYRPGKPRTAPANAAAATLQPCSAPGGQRRTSS